MRQALAIRHPTPGQFYGVFHTGIYLILHSPIPGPTTSHNLLQLEIIPVIELKYLGAFKSCHLVTGLYA
jgi:hypothetical protein